MARTVLRGERRSNAAVLPDTGYNAALAAHLAGPGGAVTTVDIDQDVVAGAQAALAAAGFDAVRVVCGDGEYGHRPGAPYDRTIITAGAWQVPAAWTDQLAPDGRLVVPLRVRGLTRSVALERQDGILVSRSLRYCGFIPIRGDGYYAEPTIRLRDDPQVSVRLDDGMSVDADALRATLEHRPVHRWLGVSVTEDRVGDVEFWLADAVGFCRLIVNGDTAASGLVEPMYRWGSMAVVQHGTIGYLTMRPAPPALDGQHAFELGVCSYGPYGDQVAAGLADRISRWDQETRAGGDIWIEVHPAGSVPDGGVVLVADKQRNRVVVRTNRPTF